MNTLPPVSTYCIAFETMPKEGYIKVTKITIEEDIMDATDVARIDLCDHPLYPILKQYVKDNER
jgi:hypothetical protein